MSLVTYNKLQYLPKEVLSNILLYLDIKFDVIKIYRDNTKSEVIKKYTVPSKICLISKSWYNAIVFSRCRTCDHGRYDRIKTSKFRCMICGHVLESKDTVAKRALKMKNMLHLINQISKKTKKIDT